ncbi:hypothetical protein U1Q18_050845, partial [Sarracenia purpurea var. burkii]
MGELRMPLFTFCHLPLAITEDLRRKSRLHHQPLDMVYPYSVPFKFQVIHVK